MSSQVQSHEPLVFTHGSVEYQSKVRGGRRTGCLIISGHGGRSRCVDLVVGEDELRLRLRAADGQHRTLAAL